MALNPAKQEERLNSPVERASNLNDPQFENQQGYFPYDLTHQEFITPLFGQVTPTMHLDTVPGDRVVVKDNTKLILNQINGNFLSNLNQYVDSFYVPLRNVFPTNYEKLIPNPVKGEDLPNSALPVVPLFGYLLNLYREKNYTLDVDGTPVISLDEISNYVANGETASLGAVEGKLYLGRLVLLSTILSRGQLLDYLGMQLDTTALSAFQSSELQSKIDAFFASMYNYYNTHLSGEPLLGVKLPLTSNTIDTSDTKEYKVSDLSTFRAAISDMLESGRMLWMEITEEDDLHKAITELVIVLDTILSGYEVSNEVEHLETIDGFDTMNTSAHVNIGKILAYQQIVAHYYTNDRVDNVYSSDLFMQNLRAVMYPTAENSIKSYEPTFNLNGINFEYDYISYGGFWASLLTDELIAGSINRQYVWGTLMLLLRRSLRFGDYFATARPNLLAVTDQLGIAVDGSSVSPIDITKNLLMQRYLNAANYIGQGFLQYMSSMYGIKPSDTGCTPRFISHRKIALENRVTTNTADDQGAQTTNIVGFSDASAFDVFIDDFGYLISLTTFDVLPVYKSGIDNSFKFTDRFDYFNPMLQGIGDQPIRSSELLGNPDLYDDVFGYTMRNSEYKFKISKAHGAFCNSLPGFMISYPLYAYNASIDDYDINIDPDFIRDKPVYLDPVIPQQTGVSPAEYYHFVVSCTNQVQCARKIQATPGVLF